MVEDEDISTDYGYCNRSGEIEESTASEENCSPVRFGSDKANKQLAGSSSYEDDY